MPSPPSISIIRERRRYHRTRDAQHPPSSALIVVVTEYHRETFRDVVLQLHEEGVCEARAIGESVAVDIRAGEEDGALVACLARGLGVKFLPA